MNAVPSSTYFSAPPDWGWFIVSYFFFGGLAGGCYLFAGLIDLYGHAEDRPLARLGYYIAFSSVAVSGPLLTLDLGQPLRFWHMLIESNTYRPMLKPWSPMSSGSWALLAFGAFTFLGCLGALAETGLLAWPVARRVRPPGLPGVVIVSIGALLGLYVAGYTGVLLAVTNRPIWSDTPLLGMLFVVSAASVSAALMILLANRFKWTMPGLSALHRIDTWAVGLELVVLIAVMISLGPVFRALLNAWGVLLLVVVVVGMLIPLTLYRRAQSLGDRNASIAAALVLLGGFVLRLVIVFAAEGT